MDLEDRFARGAVLRALRLKTGKRILNTDWLNPALAELNRLNGLNRPNRLNRQLAHRGIKRNGH